MRSRTDRSAPAAPARTLCLLALGFILSGCRVDQAGEVALYRKVIDLEAPATRPNAEPLTLRQALLLANQNNEDLRSRGEDYLRTLISRHRTAANFLPTVNLVPSYLRRDPTGGGGGSEGGSDGGGSSNNSTFDVSAELNWNLFDGFRDMNRYWRDTFLIEQQRHLLLSFQEALLLDVARVYYQILRSEASVRVLENSLTVQEARLREARGRLEAGTARPLDVAQTESQVSATRTTLINARLDIRNARELLVLLTAAPLRDVALVDSFALPADIDPLEAYLTRARSARHDLVAARAAIEAARRDVQVAFGQYYPSISLDLTGYLYREAVPTDRDWQGLLSANLPLFSAGRIHADVREAWSFVREALLVRDFLDRRVEQEVRTAYHDLSASEARLAELKIRLAAAEQAFEQAEASYRVGLATNLERVAAQDALLDAQLQLSSEEYDRKVLYMILLQRIGVVREGLEQ